MSLANVPGTSVKKLSWDGNVRIEIPGDPARSAYFLAGLGTSAGLWRRQVTAFSGTGAAVVADSLAGHDGTLALYERSGATDWYAAAEAELLALFRARDEPVTLIGFSAGGLVAAKLAHMHPEAVRALFLTGYCPQLKSWLKQEFLERCQQLYRFVPPIRPLMRKMSFAAEGNTRADLLTEEYLTQPRYARYPLRVLFGLLDLQDELYLDFLKIRCPIHFFHGEHDSRTPVSKIEDLAALVGRLQQRDVPLRRYERSPHCVPLGLDAEAFTADLLTAACSYW